MPALKSKARKQLQQALRHIRKVSTQSKSFSDTIHCYIEERKSGRRTLWVVKGTWSLSGSPIEVACFQIREAAEFFLWALRYGIPLLNLAETMSDKWPQPGSKKTELLIQDLLNFYGLVLQCKRRSKSCEKEPQS